MFEGHVQKSHTKTSDRTVSKKNHLFERIPQLKLPHLLTRYLLHNMSLETSKNQVDVAKFAGADHENGKGKPKRENDVT